MGVTSSAVKKPHAIIYDYAVEWDIIHPKTISRSKDDGNS